MSDQRWRTALHESAHAVVALLIGVDVDLVSIRPGKAHAGISFPVMPGWHGDVRRAAATPGPFVDPELRRVVEMRAVVSLAGDIGAMLQGPAPSRYGSTRDERLAESLSRKLERLSPRHVELLHDAEEVTEHRDDYGLATDALAALGNGNQISAHLVWLRTVAAKLVRDYADEIVAVAEQLYRRHVMTGAEIRAAMRAVQPRTKEHRMT